MENESGKEKKGMEVYMRFAIEIVDYGGFQLEFWECNHMEGWNEDFRESLEHYDYARSYFDDEEDEKLFISQFYCYG